jgi:putative addiction module component (TIGR02574 family)
MARNAADLLNDALALPEAERARLARALIDSLEPEDGADISASEIESAWRAEIERRERDIERDPTVLIPAEQVFAEAERRLREIRKAQGRYRRSG